MPHLLAASEAAQLAGGGPTPFTDVHMVLQALFTPVYGAGIAGVALAGFGRVAHPIACVLGVIGGVALIAVAPLLLATGNGAFAMLFLPANGTWVFLTAVGVRAAMTGRAESRATSTLKAS